MPAREQRTTLGTPTGYDQSLIAQAPEITKADRQEGYDINLLEQGNKVAQPPISRPRTVPPPSASDPSLEKSAVPPVPTSNGHGHGGIPPATRTKSAVPWYRTKKGLLILIVLAVVIIAAVVGGAVGATVGKKNHNNASNPFSTSSSSTAGSVPVNTGEGGQPSTATPTTTTDGANQPPSSGTSADGSAPTGDTGSSGDSGNTGGSNPVNPNPNPGVGTRRV